MRQNCDNLHPTSQFTGSYVWVYENRRWAAPSTFSVCSLSCLIACSLSAALCSRQCRIPSRAAMPISPCSAPTTTLTRWCPRQTEMAKMWKPALHTLLVRLDSCHLPETQHSSPQHRCCGSWGLIYHCVTYCTLSWWY